MLRIFVGFAAAALTAAALLAPDSGFARGGGIGGAPGGIRGFHPGLRPMFRPHRPAGFVGTPRIGVRPPPARPPLASSPVTRTHFTSPLIRHVTRQHHRRVLNGWVYPVTVGPDYGYIGIPYDPGEQIPVYVPAPLADPGADPSFPRYLPRVTNVGEPNGEACNSERVIVPATEAEREILVVRC